MSEDKYDGYFEVYHPKHLAPMARFERKIEAEKFVQSQAFPTQYTIVQIGDEIDSPANTERSDKRFIYATKSGESSEEIKAMIISELTKNGELYQDFMKTI